MYLVGCLHCTTQLQWKAYLGDKKVALDNDYRTTLLNDTRLVNTNYLNYGCDGGPVDRYYWPKLRDTQLYDLSGANGIFKNSYSTIDFYPITPSRWKVQNVNLTVNGDLQVPRGWKWVARARQEELRIYDKLMAPYVGAGWYPDEERNFRPGQWLGVLKCLGLTGADFYHAYYDYADGEPKGYGWQVVTPSYAQAILSRIDHIIVYGKVLNGDLLATPGNTSQGPAYSFNTGNPLHLVTIRQDSDAVAQTLIPKYAISGSIQKIINMIGDAPLSQDVQIDLKAGLSPVDNLQFNIRRQGSTYVLDRTRSNSNDYAFYQLDKWHQWEHPERWSKDLDFEAEVFDNPTATLETSIHTEDVNHTAITNGDYRNFTSYVSGSANIYQYNFQPRVDIATTYYAFIRCRRNGGTATTSIQVNLNDITGATSFPTKTIGCVASNDWLWYMVYDNSGNALQYSLTRHNYMLSIQASDNNILIDRIYFGLTNAAPENGIAVASYNCPGPIQFTAEVTPVTCYGASSGAIKMTASGVTSGNYDFAINGVWQSGTNPFTNSIMTAGSYSLQVRDHNNTTTVSQIYLVTISQPLTPFNCIMQATNNCNNLNVGKITAVVTGGNLNNYTYQWSNGEKNGTIENLSNGTYTVTVTDAKGCSVSNNATIVTKIFQASATSGNASGTGCGSGSLTISLVSGSGTAPYLFSIDGGLNYINNSNSSSFTIYNRTPGNYICQLKDFDGCLASMSGNPVNIVPGTTGFTTTITANPLNLSCNGLTSNFTLTPSPASSDYKYLWSTGQNTKNISNKPAGTYTVVVTNTVTGCISQNVVTVSEPTQIVFNINTTNVTCFGGNNGTASILALSGGTGALGILWSTGSTLNSISGLSAGNYSVTVTDGNNCSLVKYFTIIAPNTILSATVTQHQDVLCNGGATGSLTVSGSNGVTPYHYLWSNTETTSIISGLSANTYIVTVTDGFNCATTKSATITQPPTITATLSATNVSCNQGNDGTISISNISNATNPYTFGINGTTFPFTSPITNLVATTYNVYIKDFVGCIKNLGSKTVTEPMAITLGNINISNTSCGTNNGSISFTTSGGTPGGTYNYLWSNGVTCNAATSCSISSLSATVYTVTISDNNSCSKTQPFTVNSNSTLQILNLNINPPTCYGGLGSIQIIATGGAGGLTYSIDNINYQSSNTFNNLPAGDYTLYVKDVSNCIVQTSILMNPTTTDCCKQGYSDLSQSDFDNSSIGSPISGFHNLNIPISIMSNSTAYINACTMVIAKNVSITVNPSATLIIQNQSNLSSCGEMWQGIINLGGTVIVENSSIEDAIDALRSETTGSTFQVTISHFARNYNSVSLINGDYATSYFYENDFDGGQTLKNSFSSTLDQTNTHFFIANSKVVIGDVGMGINTLRKGTFGIYMSASTLDIDNCIFDQPGVVNNSVGQKAGIYCRNHNLLNCGINNINSTSKPVTFQDGTQGIYQLGNTDDINVKHCAFSNLDAGISCEYSWITNLSVDSNTFADCDNGMFLSLVNSSENFEILDNTFTGATDIDHNPENYNAIGIYFPMGYDFDMEISRNTIIDYPIGIYALNLRSKVAVQRISENMISYGDLLNVGAYLHGMRGIQMQNCYHTMVTDNSVVWDIGALDPNSTYDIRGIYFDNSQMCLIKDNHVEKMGNGIYASNHCEETALRCNAIVDCYPDGMHFDNIVLPDQGDYSHPTFNNWFGVYSSASNVNKIDVSGNQIYWYYDGLAVVTNPMYPKPSPFLINDVYAGGYDPNDYPCTINNQERYSGDPNARSSNIDLIVQDAKTYLDNIDENKYYDKDYAYKMMKIEPTLITDEIHEDFMQLHADDPIGLYSEVQDLAIANNVAAAAQINNIVYDQNLIEENKKSVNQIFLASNNLDSLFELDSTIIPILESIAYQSVVTGGEGVYWARGLLKLRIEDSYTSSSRFSSNQKAAKPSNDIKLYPNPTNNYVFVEALKGGLIRQIEAFDSQSSLVSHNIEVSNKIKLNTVNLKDGFYTLVVQLEDNSLHYLKLSIIH